jgi:hypothetical protein
MLMGVSVRDHMSMVSMNEHEHECMCVACMPMELGQVGGRWVADAGAACDI